MLKRNQANNQADRQLVDEILGGETKRFETVIKNTKGLVTQIVFKMINSVEDRRDLAQEIYLKAYQNLSKFRFQSKLSTWIGQIAYNTCLHYLEKKKLVILDHDDSRTQEELLESLSKKLTSHSSESTEPDIFKGPLSEIIQAEIEKLSPLYKTLVTLYHQEELSYEEITQITDLPMGTVKNYLFRARKKLKDSLLLNYKREEL